MQLYFFLNIGHHTWKVETMTKYRMAGRYMLINSSLPEHATSALQREPMTYANAMLSMPVATSIAAPSMMRESVTKFRTRDTSRP